MKEIRTTIYVVLVLSLLLGILYPLLVTGIGQLAFPWRASGSLVTVSGRVVGSELIGQQFASLRYFHGRPSASDYNALASGASNFGPSNASFLALVRERVAALRTEEGLPDRAAVPADLVLASGSGLDPDISVEGALVQVRRIAETRELDSVVVRNLVERMAVAPFLGAFGERRVNVLRLNLALDALS